MASCRKTRTIIQNEGRTHVEAGDIPGRTRWNTLRAPYFLAAKNKAYYQVPYWTELAVRPSTPRTSLSPFPEGIQTAQFAAG